MNSIVSYLILLYFPSEASEFYRSAPKKRTVCYKNILERLGRFSNYFFFTIFGGFHRCTKLSDFATQFRESEPEDVAYSTHT